MFDKGSDLFPIKDKFAFLSHCSIAPLYKKAAEKAIELLQKQTETGSIMFSDYVPFLDKLRKSAAELLNTSPDNLALVKNTSEAMGMIANGYPFSEGDEIISYIHEYPANHYPWKLQEKKGVKLKLLPDRQIYGIKTGGRPCAWLMEDLEKMVTEKTKIIALSHVQFVSGFAADLKALGSFCHKNGLDLVIDAAQSLGSLPIDPEEMKIDALAASGWKWLMGPVGCGLFYTSQSFRSKLEHVMTGAELVEQGTDYLNHTWKPFTTANRFQYSTSPVYLAVALETCINDLCLRYGIDNIQKEIFRLQSLFLQELDSSKYTPIVFPEEHRSGILSIIGPVNPNDLQQILQEKGILCSARGGYLRIAPHFSTSEDEVFRAASTLNAISG